MGRNRQFENELQATFYKSEDKYYSENDTISVTKLPFDLYIACREGEFSLSVKGNYYTVGKDEVCLIPSDTEYMLNITKDSELVYVAASLYAYVNLKIFSLFDLSYVFKGESGRKICRYCDNICRLSKELEFTTFTVEYSMEIHTDVTNIFNITIQESVQKAEKFEVIESYKKMADIFEYVDKYTYKIIRQKELSDIANMYPDTFYRSFKQLTGMAPKDFIISEKLNVARQYLALSNMTIHDISAMVGYEDQFYFSALFRKRFKMSPSKYKGETVRLI